jgi:hypothetical protein
MNWNKIFVVSCLAFLLLGMPVNYIWFNGLAGFGYSFFGLFLGLVGVGIVSKFKITTAYSGYWSLGLGLLLVPTTYLMEASVFVWVNPLLVLFFVAWIYALEGLEESQKAKK